MKNKKGMTLVEVLVYVVLAGFLLAPVVMLMQNSSVSMARDAVSTNLNMSGREILNIIYDDLKNTGYKVRPNDYTANDSLSYMNLTATGVPAVVATALTTPTPCSAVKANTAQAIADTMKRYGISYLDYVNVAQRLTSGSPAICTKATNVTDSIIADKLAKIMKKGIDTTGSIDISSFRVVKETHANGIYFDSLIVKVGRLKPDGSWDGVDSILYNVRGNKQGLVRNIKGVSSARIDTLARNVKALKFRYSDDLETWLDAPLTVAQKNNVQYIKAILVLMDPKKMSPIKNQVINIIDNTVVLQDTGKYLYERFEIVIPVPNNGLYP